MLFLGGLAVSATCLVVAIVVVGIGSIAVTAIGRELGIGDSFWIGLSFAVAVLEIWSLFLPIKCAALVSW
jgi:hypothetical protein